MTFYLIFSHRLLCKLATQDLGNIFCFPSTQCLISYNNSKPNQTTVVRAVYATKLYCCLFEWRHFPFNRSKEHQRLWIPACIRHWSSECPMGPLQHACVRVYQSTRDPGLKGKTLVSFSWYGSTGIGETYAVVSLLLVLTDLCDVNLWVFVCRILITQQSSPKIQSQRSFHKTVQFLQSYTNLRFSM